MAYIIKNTKIIISFLYISKINIRKEDYCKCNEFVWLFVLSVSDFSFLPFHEFDSMLVSKSRINFFFSFF